MKYDPQIETKAGECISVALVVPDIRRATAYISDKLTVKVTHQRRITKRDRYVTLLVTAGEPNAVERKFIKTCKKAGEPFPLKKIQLKFWRKKK